MDDLEKLIRSRVGSPGYGAPVTSLMTGQSPSMSQEALDVIYLLDKLDEARQAAKAAQEALDARKEGA